MFTKNSIAHDVSIIKTSYGFWKLRASSEKGLAYLTDNGFLPYNYSKDTPYEIEEPFARHLVYRYLMPSESLEVFAPQLAPLTY